MRGTGTTTQQLKSAPPGSLFIYCTRDTTYAKTLLKKLGRDDVTIRGIDALDRIDTMWTAARYSAVIVDHAVVSTTNRHRALVTLMSLSRDRNTEMIDLHDTISQLYSASPSLRSEQAE